MTDDEELDRDHDQLVALATRRPTRTDPELLAHALEVIEAYRSLWRNMHETPDDAPEATDETMRAIDALVRLGEPMEGVERGEEEPAP